MGWLLRNAVDENLAFVVGCDREPVDVVLGHRAQLWKWVRSVRQERLSKAISRRGRLASKPPRAVARSPPLSYQNFCTSSGFEKGDVGWLKRRSNNVDGAVKQHDVAAFVSCLIAVMRMLAGRAWRDLGHERAASSPRKLLAS
jgi:hypothetical protein